MHVPVGVVAPAGAGAPPGRIAAPGAAPQRPQVCAHQPARAIQSALHWPQLFFWAHVLPSAGWQAEANDASVHVYALPHTYAMPKAWQRADPATGRFVVVKRGITVWLRVEAGTRGGGDGAGWGRGG